MRGLSIIMPAHNAAVHLERSLPQVLRQDYPLFEVVVVVDSCTDLTQEKLEQLELRWPALRHIVMPASAWHHDRLYLAMSLGVKAARYDWVMMLQPDFAPQSSRWLALMADAIGDGVKRVVGYCSIENERLSQYIYAHEQWISMAFRQVGVEHSNVLALRDEWLSQTSRATVLPAVCVCRPEVRVLRTSSYGNAWWNSHLRAVRRYNSTTTWGYKVLHIMSVWLPLLLTAACAALSLLICWWWGVVAYMCLLSSYTVAFAYYCRRVGEHSFIFSLWLYSLQLPLLLKK